MFCSAGESETSMSRPPPPPPRAAAAALYTGGTMLTAHGAAAMSASVSLEPPPARFGHGRLTCLTSIIRISSAPVFDLATAHLAQSSTASCSLGSCSAAASGTHLCSPAAGAARQHAGNVAGPARVQQPRPGGPARDEAVCVGGGRVGVDRRGGRGKRVSGPCLFRVPRVAVAPRGAAESERPRHHARRGAAQDRRRAAAEAVGGGRVGGTGGIDGGGDEGGRQHLRKERDATRTTAAVSLGGYGEACC